MLKNGKCAPLKSPKTKAKAQGEGRVFYVKYTARTKRGGVETFDTEIVARSITRACELVSELCAHHKWTLKRVVSVIDLAGVKEAAS